MRRPSSKPSPVQLSSKKENEPVQVTFKTPEANRNVALPDAEKRCRLPAIQFSLQSFAK